MLEDYQNCIFDFGGGNNASGFNFEFDRIKNALHPYENVILLFPCEDKQEALEFIYERRKFTNVQKELIEHIVFDVFKFAKHIVFVKGKTLEEVCNEVLAVTNNR